MRIVNIIAYILVIVGALNWGLFGFFNFNLVSSIFSGARTAGSCSEHSEAQQGEPPSVRPVIVLRNAHTGSRIEVRC